MRAGGEKERKIIARGDGMAKGTDWFWTKIEIRNQVLLMK